MGNGGIKFQEFSYPFFTRALEISHSLERDENGWILSHNNAAGDLSFIVQEFLETKGNSMLLQPFYSPDMNYETFSILKDIFVFKRSLPRWWIGSKGCATVVLTVLTSKYRHRCFQLWKHHVEIVVWSLL